MSEDDKKIKPFKHEGHKLVTRRDFLANGFMGLSTLAFAPNILGVLSNTAYAQQAPNCGNTAGSALNPLPILCFDLAGGANIAGSNVMVGGPGGQMDYLPDYQRLGLPPDFHPRMPGQTNSEFGLVFHADSGFLRGMQSVTSAATRANIDGAIFCAASNDDTSNNPHNPMYWLAKAGAIGELTNLAGTRSSVSGGRSVSPPMSIDPTLQPVRLNRPQDALSLINIGKLGELFGSANAEKVMRTIERLSQAKIQRLANQTLPQQIKDLVRCGYLQSIDSLTKFSADSIDAAADNMVNQAFNNLNDRDQRKTATLAKLILDGFIGAGTVEKGGYDYHDKTRATGEVRDFAAGQLIGRSLELAALKGRPLMVYIFTDGGVAANRNVDNSQNGRGKYEWQGDKGSQSSSFFLVYSPSGRPNLRSSRRQIGHFNENAGVNRNANVLSNNVINLAKAVVANYLALRGEESKLAQVVGDNPFGNNLDQYLIFNKLADIP